jgi:outer membrane protein assembly factor BamB
VRLGWARVRRGVVGLTVAAVAGGLVVLGARGGYPAEHPRLLSGAAWLASSRVGQLSLLDGSSAEVSAQVQVATPGDRIAAVQQSSTAYAVDETGATVRRVDGADFQPSPAVTPVPGAAGGLQVFAGAGALYALDTRRGILATADPETLQIRGGAVPLAVQADSTDAVLDDAGRLWVLDAGTGDLVWVDHGARHSSRALAHPGSQLVLVDGVPVVVDLATRRAMTIDPGSGTPGDSIGLDVRPGDTVAVGGSTNGHRLYLAASRGVLEICDL